MSIVPLSIALILTCSLGQAQAPTPPLGQLPEFEVASVKPNKTHERMYYGLRNTTLTVRNMPVKGLIQIAYGKRESQITGGPAWIASQCVDVDAKAESHQKANQDMEQLGLKIKSIQAPETVLVIDHIEHPSEN